MAELIYVEAVRSGLAEEMARDESIFVVGEGIGPRGGNFNTTIGLYEKYGEKRLRDTPISERGFLTLCTGAAIAGARPVVDAMFLDFAIDGMGDMVHQTAMLHWMSGGRLKVPWLLRCCVGVYSSAGSHHSGCFYPFLVHVPGFRVVMPSNPRDGKGLIKTALRCDDPVVFLEHRGVLTVRGDVPDDEYLTPLGEAEVVQAGTDVTVVTFGYMVHQTIAACTGLGASGASVEVIDLRSLAPLDIGTVLESVGKTGRLLIVDDDYAPCGIGAEVAAQVVDQGFDLLDAPIKRLNGAFCPVPYSKVLEDAQTPGVESIETAIRDLLAE